VWYALKERLAREGRLSWTDFALHEFRNAVADEFEIGPEKPKKKSKRLGEPGAAAGGSGSGAEVDAPSAQPSSSSSSSIPAGPSGGSLAPGAASLDEGSTWSAPKCPLQSDEADMITKVDVAISLGRVHKTKNCGGVFATRLGTSLMRAKLGL
jgi:hypothetical protein